MTKMNGVNKHVTKIGKSFARSFDNLIKKLQPTMFLIELFCHLPKIKEHHYIVDQSMTSHHCI